MTSKIICVADNHTLSEKTAFDAFKFQITDVRRSADGRAFFMHSPQPVKDVRAALVDHSFQGDVLAFKTHAPLPKLLICDMDSTIIESETLDDLAAAFNLKDKIAAITERAMRGELDFSAALDARVSMLADLEEQAILDLLPELRISKGAQALVDTAKEYGATCLLVSGGFRHVTGYVADKLGFDDHFGNEFIIEDGRLTGKVKQPIQDKNTKLRILNDFCDHLDIMHEEVMAIGDGANDIPMLQEAGFGIAYKAKPLVRQAVPLQINHTDLATAKYLFEFTKTAKD